MLTASVILFMYAALSGFVMAVGIFKGARRWMPLALGHGVLAVTGLVLALLASLATGVAAIQYGVAVLFLAALEGSYSSAIICATNPILAGRGAACIARPRRVGCLVFALLS